MKTIPTMESRTSSSTPGSGELNAVRPITSRQMTTISPKIHNVPTEFSPDSNSSNPPNGRRGETPDGSRASLGG